MFLLIALLACGGDDTTQPTDANKIEANVAGGDAPQGNMNQGPNGQGPNGQGPNEQGNVGQGQDQGQGGDNQGTQGGQGGQGGQGTDGTQGGQAGQDGAANGPNGDINAPNNGENIGDAVPPEDGQNIGDPNVPPDTINQTVGKDGETPPQPMEMGNSMGDSSGVQQEPKKKPPTFIYNANSEDSGPLYKTADGTCFVRKSWDQPNNGVMGDIEQRDCPQQMASDAWSNCPNGRLVKHNVGDKEGTCECEPIVSGEAAAVDCP